MALKTALFPAREEAFGVKPSILVDSCPVVSLKSSWAWAEGLKNTPAIINFRRVGIPWAWCDNIL